MLEPTTALRFSTIATVLLGLTTLIGCGGGIGAGASVPVGSVTPGGGAGQGADLKPISIDMVATALTAGDSISVTDTVENIGDQAGSNFQVGVYLSPDANVDVTDTLLGFRTIGSLGVGATSIGGGSVTIPLATTAGDYFVGVIVDDLNTVSEPNENNNVLVASDVLTVNAAQLPELTVDSVSFSPLILDAGDSLQVTEAVVNNGIVAASGVVVGVYLSGDATVTSADILLGFRTLASLDVGEGSMNVGSLVVPSNLFAGNYNVGVIVDDGNSIAESNETNNTLIAAFQVRVNAPPRPDLTSSGLSFGPNTVDAGQSIQVSEAIFNQGLADSSAFRVGIYLSADATITTSDILIAVRNLPSLPIGITSAVSGVTTFIPSNTPGGTYFVGIIVDDLDAIVESDEGNNALAAFGSLTVTIPPTPDLFVNSFSFTPTSVMPALGDQITVTETIGNQGVVNAGAFRVGYYLSGNPLVSKNDILIGSRMISALAVGDSSTSSTAVVLPAGLAPGSYFLGAIADDQSAVIELLTTNNVFTAPIALDVVAAPIPMAQLNAESVSFSPQVVPDGTEVQIEDIVRNLGTISATAFRVGFFLSVDSNIDTTDILIGERIVSHLSINFGSASSAPYTVPVGTPPGTYRLAVFNDYGFDIPESDEDDNIIIAPGFITVN